MLSAMPVDFKYCSAFFAIYLVSLVYGFLVTGSYISHNRLSVGTSHTGSTTAVDGSGISIMSDSCIFWNPLMDEPSKPIPSTHIDLVRSSISVISEAGMEKCCHSPGRSLNLRSTICILFSLTIFMTSLAAFSSKEPLASGFFVFITFDSFAFFLTIFNPPLFKKKDALQTRERLCSFFTFAYFGTTPRLSFVRSD